MFTDTKLNCQIHQKFFFFYQTHLGKTDYFIHNSLKLAKFYGESNIERRQKQNLVNPF